MSLFTLIADISNPALPAGLQNAANPDVAGTGLGKYIGILWQTSLVLGGLAVVAYMIMGGLTWISAGGDKGKIEQAKERITQGLIGLAVLFSVGAISTFFGTALGIDLLAPDFTRISGDLGGTSSTGTGSTNPYCQGKTPITLNNPNICNTCGGKNQGMCGFGISDTCNCNAGNAPCDPGVNPDGRGGCK